MPKNCQKPTGNVQSPVKSLNGKNNTIEFWRFIFTIWICLLHFDEGYAGRYYFSSGGYLGVDFFFILAGFLMMQHAMKQNQGEEASLRAGKYFVSRIDRLYPHYIFSFFIMFLVTSAFVNRMGFLETLKSLYSAKWEILMMQYSGLAGITVLNIPTWYISALIISSYFIYYLISRWEDVFNGFLAPIGVILIYTYISRVGGSLDYTQQYAGFILGALLRATAGLCLGCICYRVCEYLKSKPLLLSKNVLNIVELTIVLLTFRILCFQGRTQEDFFILVLFSILIIFSFLQVTFLSRLLNGKVSEILGGISYAVFCNHFLFRILIPRFLPNIGYFNAMPFFLMASILYSFLTDLLIGHWRALRYR